MCRRRSRTCSESVPGGNPALIDSSQTGSTLRAMKLRGFVVVAAALARARRSGECRGAAEARPDHRRRRTGSPRRTQLPRLRVRRRPLAARLRSRRALEHRHPRPLALRPARPVHQPRQHRGRHQRARRQRQPRALGALQRRQRARLAADDGDDDPEAAAAAPLRPAGRRAAVAVRDRRFDRRPRDPVRRPQGGRAARRRTAPPSSSTSTPPGSPRSPRGSARGTRSSRRSARRATSSC